MESVINIEALLKQITEERPENEALHLSYVTNSRRITTVNPRQSGLPYRDAPFRFIKLERLRLIKSREKAGAKVAQTGVLGMLNCLSSLEKCL